MSKLKDISLTLTGLAVGLTIGGQSAIAALTASPSTQRFYVNGMPYALTAYSIAGNNYVKLRDIGRAVDFGVTYDGTTNSVYIDPDKPYVETKAPASGGDRITLTANLAIRQEIIRLANQVRVEAGVPPLTVNAALMDAAQDCSAQGFTDHDTRYECESALAHGYPYGACTNLAILSGGDAEDFAQRAVTCWVNSPGHNRTMIDKDADSIGAGVTVVGGTAYCYLFVGDSGSHNPYE